MRSAKIAGISILLAAVMMAAPVSAAPTHVVQPPAKKAPKKSPKKDPKKALEDLKKKLEEAKKELEARKKAVADVGEALSGKFKVQYNYNRIKTNLGGKTRVMTFAQFKRLRIPIGKKGVPVSPQTIKNLEDLPRRIIMESNGIVISIQAKDGGKVGGRVNAKEKAFGITALNGAIITGAGVIVSGGQVKGKLVAEDPSRVKGTVGFGIGGVAGGGSGGVFVAIPFRAIKVK